MGAQIIALEEALAQKTQDLESYSNEMDTVVSGLEEERDELKKQLAAATAAAAAAAASSTTAPPSDYDSLKKSDAEKQAQIAKLTAKISELEKSGEAEKAEILTYSKQVDKLRNQAAEYSSEIEKFKATISTKDSEVTSLQISNKELLGVGAEQKAMVEKQGKDLMESLKAKREYEARIATLEHELADARDHTTKLAAEYGQYRDKTTKALKEKSGDEAATNHIHELEIDNAEKSKSCSDCKTELTKVKAELMAALTTIEGL